MRNKITTFVNYGYLLLVVLYTLQDLIFPDTVTVYVQNNFAQLFIPVSLGTLIWYGLNFRRVFLQSWSVSCVIAIVNLAVIVLMSGYLFVIYKYFTLNMI